jgi:maleamate amidohydrolase
VVGTTIPGCVRATAVDAFSLKYRVTLAEEARFHRSKDSHAVSLCDMHAKFVDVVPTAEILSYFDELPRVCSIANPQSQSGASEAGLEHVH